MSYCWGKGAPLLGSKIESSLHFPVVFSCLFSSDSDDSGVLANRPKGINYTPLIFLRHRLEPGTALPRGELVAASPLMLCRLLPLTSLHFPGVYSCPYLAPIL